MSSTVPANPPRVVCPAWCDVPPAEHVADLADYEGKVVHRRRVWSSDLHNTDCVSLGLTTRLDGTVDNDDVDPWNVVNIEVSDVLTIDKAVRVGRAIVDAAELAAYSPLVERRGDSLTIHRPTHVPDDEWAPLVGDLTEAVVRATVKAATD